MNDPQLVPEIVCSKPGLGDLNYFRDFINYFLGSCHFSWGGGGGGGVKCHDPCCGARNVQFPHIWYSVVRVGRATVRGIENEQLEVTNLLENK